MKCIGVDAISSIHAFFEQLMGEFGGSEVEPRDRIKILSEGSPNYTVGLPESKHKNSRITLLMKIGERMREIAEKDKLFIFTMKNDAIDVCVKK